MPIYVVKGVRLNISKEDEEEFLKDNPTAVLETKQDKKESKEKSTQDKTNVTKQKNNPVSYDEETGEPLPFDKNLAGKGDDKVPLDIKPWYGDEMKTNYTPQQWSDFVKQTGFKPTVRNTAKNPKAQVQEFQWYLAHHPDWKDSITQLHGTTDKGFGQPTKSKKKYDGYLGRRWDKIIESKPTVAKQPEQKKQEPQTQIQAPGTVTNAARKPFTKTGTTPVIGQRRPAWWAQDILGMTADAMRLSDTKRYLPWQARAQVFMPDFTLYDPAREIGATQEQANIQTQGLAAFTGAQNLSARSAAIQGQAAKNIADVMSRYNNLNVGITNQFAQERSNIMNTASQNQANLDTQLFDKYTVANQQFDNAIGIRKDRLAQRYINAVTNKAKTQALNTMYPNYFTDPSMGGYVNFIGDPNKIRANRPDLTNDYLDALELTGDPNRALEYLKIQKGMAGKGSGAGYDESANYLRNQGYQGTPGSYAQESEEG